MRISLVMITQNAARSSRAQGPVVDEYMVVCGGGAHLGGGEMEGGGGQREVGVEAVEVEGGFGAGCAEEFVGLGLVPCEGSDCEGKGEGACQEDGGD